MTVCASHGASPRDRWVSWWVCAGLAAFANERERERERACEFHSSFIRTNHVYSHNTSTRTKRWHGTFSSRHSRHSRHSNRTLAAARPSPDARRNQERNQANLGIVNRGAQPAHAPPVCLQKSGVTKPDSNCYVAKFGRRVSSRSQKGFLNFVKMPRAPSCPSFLR